MSQQQQNNSVLCFDKYVLAIDGYAYSVGDKHIYRGQYSEIIPFIREEMIAVCHCSENALIEIRNEYGNTVHPFRVEGKHLMLSPYFFGKGYSLWISNEKIIDLTVDYWCEFVGDVDSLLN